MVLATAKFEAVMTEDLVHNREDIHIDNTKFVGTVQVHDENEYRSWRATPPITGQQDERRAM